MALSRPKHFIIHAVYDKTVILGCFAICQMDWGIFVSSGWNSYLLSLKFNEPI